MWVCTGKGVVWAVHQPVQFTGSPRCGQIDGQSPSEAIGLVKHENTCAQGVLSHSIQRSKVFEIMCRVQFHRVLNSEI